jgi:hypothetical protein
VASSVLSWVYWNLVRRIENGSVEPFPALPHSGVNALSSMTAALERNVPNLPFGI